jgi:hypothetical protein
MENKNFTKIALTVILASAAIVGSGYAYNGYNKANDPLEITSDFYQEWINYEANPLADKLYQDNSALSSDMEEKIESMVKGFDKGGYDPVLLAQDKPESIEMETTRVSDKVALVTVTETFGGTQKEIKVDLIKNGSGWQINDIRDDYLSESRVLAHTEEMKNKVGDHIRENIADLSPEEPVLGGSFYVTKISFPEVDKAEVEYEDGHIALKAKAEYELLPDGTVRIDNFELIDGRN